MTKADAINKVVGAVRMIQEMSGLPVGDLTEATIPIGGVVGFDSLNGVEVAVIVGATNTRGLVNICVSDDGRRALSVGEIADSLIRLVSTRG